MHTGTRNLREWLLPSQLTFFHCLWRRTFLNAIMGEGPVHLRWLMYNYLLFSFKLTYLCFFSSYHFTINTDLVHSISIICDVHFPHDVKLSYNQSVFILSHTNKNIFWNRSLSSFVIGWDHFSSFFNVILLNISIGNFSFGRLLTFR